MVGQVYYSVMSTLQFLVRTITQDTIAALPTAAEIDSTGLFSLIFHRDNFRTLMRSVAKRLLIAFSTSTQPVAFFGLNLDRIGGFAYH